MRRIRIFFIPVFFFPPIAPATKFIPWIIPVTLFFPSFYHSSPPPQPLINIRHKPCSSFWKENINHSFASFYTHTTYTVKLQTYTDHAFHSWWCGQVWSSKQWTSSGEAHDACVYLIFACVSLSLDSRYGRLCVLQWYINILYFMYNLHFYKWLKRSMLFARTKYCCWACLASRWFVRALIIKQWIWSALLRLAGHSILAVRQAAAGTPRALFWF